MLGANVWRQMLGVDKATVIESVGIDEEANAVVARAPAQGDQASLRTVRGPRRATTRARVAGAGDASTSEW